MAFWLLLAPFVVSTAYAIYELRRSSHHWPLAVGVVVSAAAVVFWFLSWPLLLTVSDSLRIDPWDMAICALAIGPAMFVTHFALVGILMWQSGPDVTDGDK